MNTAVVCELPQHEAEGHRAVLEIDRPDSQLAPDLIRHAERSDHGDEDSRASGSSFQPRITS